LFKNDYDMTEKPDIKKRIDEIETEMSDASFWEDRERADAAMSELNHLKSQLSKVRDGEKNYDDGNAVVTIFAGAGGTDAEDFVRMLLEMYAAYITATGWSYTITHEHQTDREGYRNVTFEITGRQQVGGAYGVFKHESGVHRLVRVSPFDADKQRHTSFAMVEVIPKFERITDVEIPEEDVEVEFSRSSGPGGQNVNKRETAVRVVHTPTGISAHVDTERSQQQNREKAMQYLAGKLHRLMEQQRRDHVEGMYVSKEQANEWGSQIRSYVLHPYKQVKDHRTGVEKRQVDAVFAGDIQAFIDAEKEM